MGMRIQNIIYRNMFCRPKVAQALNSFGQTINRLGIPFKTGATRDMAVFLVSKNSDEVAVARDRLLSSGSPRALWVIRKATKEISDQEVYHLSKELGKLELPIVDGAIRALASTGMTAKQIIRIFRETAELFGLGKKKKEQAYWPLKHYQAAVGCFPAAIARGIKPGEMIDLFARLKNHESSLENIYSALPVAITNGYRTDESVEVIGVLFFSPAGKFCIIQRLDKVQEKLSAIFSAKLMAAHLAKIEEGLVKYEKEYDCKPSYEHGRYKRETYYEMSEIVQAFIEYAGAAAMAAMPADKITERALSILETSHSTIAFEAYGSLLKDAAIAQYNTERLYDIGRGIYDEYLSGKKGRGEEVKARVSEAAYLLGSFGATFVAANKNGFSEDQALGLAQRMREIHGDKLMIFTELSGTSSMNSDVAHAIFKMAELLDGMQGEELSKDEKYAFISRVVEASASKVSIFLHLIEMRKSGLKSGELPQFYNAVNDQKNGGLSVVWAPDILRLGVGGVDSVALLAELKESYPGRSITKQGFLSIVSAARTYAGSLQELKEMVFEEVKTFPLNADSSLLLFGFQYPEVERELGFPVRKKGERYQLSDPNLFINNPSEITPAMLAQYAVAPHDMEVIKRLQNALIEITGGQCLGSTARGTFLPVAPDIDIMRFDSKDSIPEIKSSILSKLSQYKSHYAEFAAALDDFVQVFYYEEGEYKLCISDNPAYFCSRLSLNIEHAREGKHLADISLISYAPTNTASLDYFKKCGIGGSPIKRELVWRNIRMARHIINTLDDEVKAMVIEQAVLQSGGSFGALLERFYSMGRRELIWPFNFNSILDTGRIFFGSRYQERLYDLAEKYHKAISCRG